MVEYEVVGDDTAQDLFTVNAENGDISAVRSLQTDTADTYTVS